MRDAIYADIGPPERAELHRSCGRYLLGTRQTALAAAPHFRAVAARGDKEAVDALLQAAVDSAATIPDQTAEAQDDVDRLLPSFLFA